MKEPISSVLSKLIALSRSCQEHDYIRQGIMSHKCSSAVPLMVFTNSAYRSLSCKRNYTDCTNPQGFTHHPVV